MEAQSAGEAEKLPTIQVHSPSEVMHLSVTTDMLSAQMLLKNTPPMARLSLPNTRIVATLQTYPAFRRDAVTSHGFSMLLRDFSPPGSLSVWTTVSATDGRVQLSRDFESASVSGSIQLIEDAPPMPGEKMQNADPVRLLITRNNETTEQSELNLKLAAPSFVALCRNHPAETQEYLRPIFHDLGQEATVFAPNPAAAWQVLAGDCNPDNGILKSVNAAIAKFDAEDFQVRQSAAQDLHQIGEPAAVTLMRLDRSKLSAAVNDGIDTFLAPYLPLSPDEAKRLGSDPGFLLDSQYCDDLALRKLAAARLASVIRQPLRFDPAADDYIRLPQVAQARMAIAAAAATTAPK